MVISSLMYCGPLPYRSKQLMRSLTETQVLPWYPELFLQLLECKADTGKRGFLHLPSLDLMPVLLSSNLRNVSPLFLPKPAPWEKEQQHILGKRKVGEGYLVNICHSIACQDYFSWCVWLGRCPLSPSVLHVHPSWSFALCRRGHSSQVERGTGNWANWIYVFFFPSDQS